MSAADDKYNRSEKGRARNDRGNAKRIFIGSYYVGTETAYARAGLSRDAVEAHLMKLHHDFRERQLAERVKRNERERERIQDPEYREMRNGQKRDWARLNL